MWGQLHKFTPRPDGLAHPFEVAMLEIAEAAVENLEAVGRCGGTEITPFNQTDTIALTGQPVDNRRTVNAAADHQKVKKIAGQCLCIALHRPPKNIIFRYLSTGKAGRRYSQATFDF
jgi:hypothetical protein